MDWWDAAIKNFSLLIIFSLPLIKIFTERTNLKQKLAQCPFNLPPIKTTCLGRKNDGKKIIDIKIIPLKNNIENKKFLIIFVKS